MLQFMNLLAKVAGPPSPPALAEQAKPAFPARTPVAGFEMSFVVFISLWTFIGLVSAYDGYLTVRYQNLLHLLEQNPVGRWIMDLDSGLELNQESDYAVSPRKLANFLGLKFAGTVVGLAIMLALHRYKAALGLLVASIMAGLQGMLAMYLMCF